MLVGKSTFLSTVDQLAVFRRPIAFDTETTGLRPYQGDRLFSVILSDGLESYYFNFQPYPGVSNEFVLPRPWLKKLQPVFSEAPVLFAHNAKFDMAFLAKELLQFKAPIHCTQAIGRVERNDRFSYELAYLAKEIGFEKSDGVSEYIAKNKLYTLQTNTKGIAYKVPHFDQVPLHIIQPYGEQDAKITWELGQSQIAKITGLHGSTPSGKNGPLQILANERRLTETCFRMEQRGIRVNLEYCQRAAHFEESIAQEAAQDFKRLTGLEFIDSGKQLAKAFDLVGERYPKTVKGNPSFTDEVLEGFISPIAQLVRDYRGASKRCNTYYLNFLKFADSQGVIHANIRQGGTETGRFSYSDPNLQNLSKEDDLTQEFVIRRAFIPREGFCFVMIDYEQMEYRLMLDYAKQMDVIAEVLVGMDIHEATAIQMGVERRYAKTLNFLLLYGGGVAKLCVALFKPTLELDILKDLVRVHFWKTAAKGGAWKEVPPGIVQENLVELTKAKDLMDLYFERLGDVKKFSSGVAKVAKERGYIRNWAGRICQFKHSQFAYAAPNHLIQGGCADVVKLAMNEIDEYLLNKQTRMVAQVHDELIFEVPQSEFEIVPHLRDIMAKVYPARHLPLRCSVDHSWVSWADKVKGLPV